MTTAATSRFRILSQNELIAPGCCIVCGTGKGPFIDFGFTLDYYGAIYFCFKNCFQEAANAFEYYSPKQHRVLKDEVSFLRRENDAQKVQIEAITRVFNELTNNIIAGTAADSAGGDSGDSAISVDETDESNSELPENTESGLIEPTDEQGRSSVQHDDSIDDLISDIDI